MTNSRSTGQLVRANQPACFPLQNTACTSMQRAVLLNTKSAAKTGHVLPVGILCDELRRLHSTQ